MTPGTKAFFTSKTVTLQPGDVRMLNVTGTFVTCIDATNPFLLGIGDTAEMVPWNLGLKARLLKGDIFTVLYVENRQATVNTVTLIVGGGGEVDDQRLNIVKTSTVPVQNQDAPTLINPGPITIAAGATIAFPGALNAGGKTRRKSIVVTNLDPASNLQVQDGAANPVATVLASTAWAVSTDADLKLKNTTGAAIAIQVMELFYTT